LALFSPRPFLTNCSSPEVLDEPMTQSRNYRKLADLGVIVIVAGVYLLSAKLGLSLASLNASVSPVWPPTGVAIALGLLLGYRSIPGVLLGALFANYLLTDVSLATAAGISIGNTLEAVTAVYLVRRFIGSRNPFQRAIDVLKFVVFAAIVSTAVSATIGNVCLCLSGSASWNNFGWLWLTWWSGDGVGALVVTPLILSWVDKPMDRWRGWRLAEAVLLFLLMALLSATVYTNLLPQSATARPWGHVTIPLLLWAAFRFGPRGVSTAMAVLSAIAIWGTIHGYGGFAIYTENEGLLFLQAYIGNYAITTLSLAAIVTERRQAERHLSGSLSVTRILAESPALADALPHILQRICKAFGWEVGAMWMVDPEAQVLRCLKVWPSLGSSDGLAASKFEATSYEFQFPSGVGLPGRVWRDLQPAWIPDVTKDANFPRGAAAAAEGFHAAFAFPIFSGENFLGVMEFFSHEIREPDKALLATFAGIGSQIGQFVERMEWEQELFESRERLVMAMGASGMGTWTRDLDGTNRVQWSPELEEIFGLKPGEFPETEEAFFDFVHPEDLDALRQAVADAIDNRTDYEIDFRYYTRDGKPGWMIGRGRAFYDADGKPYRLAGLGWDVTGRKQAEEERERLSESERAASTEAEDANSIKDEFLATLSHELRTPLTAMLGWLSMLRAERLDQETTVHALETVERNARAQAQLIEDLVDVSRIAGGKLKLDVRAIDLMPVIAAAVDIVRPAANAKGVHIHVSSDATAGVVSGDPARLQQVIWNLLSNAVKFTSRDGHVYVSFRRSDSSAELVVRDTGMGIHPEFLPRVFERFRQAESPLTRSHTGLGLGLAIVRHLIELHGGTVAAESPGEGLGATFTIRMPLTAILSEEGAAYGSDQFVDQKARTDRQPLEGVRVLVVEDEPDARELLSLTLECSGAKVEAVESAQEALENLAVFKPDVLLSDIGLPVESGYDLIRKVRSLASEASNIPAVALTAFATEKDRQLAISAGFQMHLAKPVEPDILVETIERLANSSDDSEKSE
jgi:PAS domain S-box-containing protein